MEKLVLLPIIIVGLLVAYYLYLNKRDNRLDEEDEKRDRTGGELHA